jgi:iron(III) transport system ATP-binding protein
VTTALALEEVTFGYGAEPILDRLTLSVAEGEILVLLGPSGGGKSTVLRLLLGFAAPVSGRVEVGGALVSADGEIRVPPEERNLAVVFQDLALWPHLTVRGNLAFGLDSRRVARATQEERIRDVLGRVGLTDKERRLPGELSGGERQRAAIARALVLEPRAILLDEPLANLDAHRKRQLMGMFREIFKERKTTALYVTHDLREAAALADRIAVLENGRVVQEGTLDDLRARPATEFVEALIADLVWTPSR